MDTEWPWDSVLADEDRASNRNTFSWDEPSLTPSQQDKAPMLTMIALNMRKVEKK